MKKSKIENFLNSHTNDQLVENSIEKKLLGTLKNVVDSDDFKNASANDDIPYDLCTSYLDVSILIISRTDNDQVIEEFFRFWKIESLQTSFSLQSCPSVLMEVLWGIVKKYPIPLALVSLGILIDSIRAMMETCVWS